MKHNIYSYSVWRKFCYEVTTTLSVCLWLLNRWRQLLGREGFMMLSQGKPRPPEAEEVLGGGIGRWSGLTPGLLNSPLRASDFLAASMKRFSPHGSSAWTLL